MREHKHSRLPVAIAAAVVAGVSWLAVPASASQDCQLLCTGAQLPVVTTTPNPVEEVIQTVEQAVDTVEEEAGRTVESVRNTVDKTASGVKDTVDAVTSSITDTPKNDTSGHLDGDNDKPRGGGQRGNEQDPRDRASASLRLAAEQATIRPEQAEVAPLAPVAPTARPTTAEPGALDRVAEIVREAAKQLAFPLALTLIVAGFLALQGRLDRRDPKLALAPVDSEQDFLSFS